MRAIVKSAIVEIFSRGDNGNALFRGGVELGTLIFGESDSPWHQGTFSPTDDFAQIRPLFNDLYSSVNGGSGDPEDIWTGDVPEWQVAAEGATAGPTQP